MRGTFQDRLLYFKIQKFLKGILSYNVLPRFFKTFTVYQLSSACTLHYCMLKGNLKGNLFSMRDFSSSDSVVLLRTTTLPSVVDLSKDNYF